ncbi:WXG100 family type VII secretion target [Paenibacillus caui]|uniref:WXG100 family type VII secretion target n=1 Tax=Paenibacillus caui TaxID=2873927 RepID=UPI001CA7B91D|nr:WXG100 family type VII secretion target [Paenibacillus caui]
MYSPGEISSAARKIHNEKADLQNTERRFAGNLGSIDTWWKGQAGKAFIDDYKRQTRQAMDRLYSEMESVQSGLERLATEVRNADEQKRMKEQQKALLERQKKAKR